MKTFKLNGNLHKRLCSSVKLPAILFILVFSFSLCAQSAINESVTIGELIDFVGKQGKNSIEDYATSKLIENLADTEYEIQAGELVDVIKYPDSGRKEVSGVCTKFKYTNVESRVTVNRSTKFKIQVSGIDKPIKFKANADVTASFSGKLHIEKGHFVGGLFFNDCVYSGALKFSKTIKASVTGSADMGVVINMNPTKQEIAGGVVRYKIEPELSANGKITDIGMPRFQVVNGGVAGQVINKLDDLFFNAVENFGWDMSLTSYIIENIVDDRILQDKIKVRKEEYTNKLARAVLADDYASWSYGQPIVKYYDMPKFASLFLEEAIEFISEGISNYEHHLPISYEFLQQDDIRETLYTALIEGDSQTIATTLGSSLACEYAMRSARPMKISATSVYTDKITPAEYCSSHVGENAKNLGNASDVIKSDWTLTPGTTLDIGAKSIKNNYQPYMQRVRYKTVASKSSGTEQGELQCWYDSQGRAQYCSYPTVKKYYGDGRCELEMRVYKKNPTATNLKPLMAIHGGSWRYRGFGFFGLESMVSHFTDRGYVVFAPFYRLVGAADGNVECNHANGKDVIADAEDALDWVLSNKSQYGAAGKVKLFGQSAGAHLAAYLAVHQKSDIERAWLMYPPTDAKDYITNWTPDTNQNGTAAIEGLLSHLSFADLSDLKGSNDPFILANSFPNTVKSQPSSYPPVFMIHGAADDLVPARQSERLCSAYGGGGSYSSTKTGGYRGVNSCGSRDSKLHLIKEGNHILDLACVDEDLSGGQLCPAGSYESERAVEASINDGLAWLAKTTPATSGSTGSSNCGKFYGKVWAGNMSTEVPKIETFCGTCGFSANAEAGFMGNGTPTLDVYCK